MTEVKGWILGKLINENNYLKNVNALFDKCCTTDKDVIRIMGKKIAAKWIREHNDVSDQRMMEVIKDDSCPKAIREWIIKTGLNSSLYI